jgi:TniQ
MSRSRGSLPCQTPAAPLPIRVRPVHGECSGSYLIRMATGNRCPPRTLLQLLGRVHHRFRPDQWVELHPQSTITLNTAALHRLATYSGIPAAHLLRALPELDHEHGNGDPVVRVSPPERAFLRSCPDCERRAGGAALTPDRHRLQLVCVRHGIWLVNTDPLLSTAPFPEVRRAATTLRKQQHRHHADTISALYRVVREWLTNDWRGLGWHTHLAKRWEARQQVLRPDTPGKDRYLLARTEHWSMLPEAVAFITVLANHHHDALTGQRHLIRSLSRALRLDSYRSTETGEHFDAHHILVPIRQQTAERARPARITSNPYGSAQPVSVGAAR